MALGQLPSVSSAELVLIRRIAALPPLPTTSTSVSTTYPDGAALSVSAATRSLLIGRAKDLIACVELASPFVKLDTTFDELYLVRAAMCKVANIDDGLKDVITRTANHLECLASRNHVLSLVASSSNFAALQQDSLRKWHSIIATEFVEVASCWLTRATQVLESGAPLSARSRLQSLRKHLFAQIDKSEILLHDTDTWKVFWYTTLVISGQC